MGILDIDKDVVSRLERVLEIDENISKQVFDQRCRLEGNTSDYNHVTLFYTDTTSGKPEIFYFITEVSRDQMIRLNYERSDFRSDYFRKYGFKNDNVVVGDLVLNEIANNVKERFTRATREKDIKNLFVSPNLPQQL